MFQLGLKCFEAIPVRRLNRIHRERQTARCHIIQDEEKRCITCARICHISMVNCFRDDIIAAQTDLLINWLLGNAVFFSKCLLTTGGWCSIHQSIPASRNDSEEKHRLLV